MDVAADGHRAADGLDVGLVHQNFPRFVAELLDIRLRQAERQSACVRTGHAVRRSAARSSRATANGIADGVRDVVDEARLGRAAAYVRLAAMQVLRRMSALCTRASPLSRHLAKSRGPARREPWANYLPRSTDPARHCCSASWATAGRASTTSFDDRGAVRVSVQRRLSVSVRDASTDDGEQTRGRGCRESTVPSARVACSPGAVRALPASFSWSSRTRDSTPPASAPAPLGFGRLMQLPRATGSYRNGSEGGGRAAKAIGSE